MEELRDRLERLQRRVRAAEARNDSVALRAGGAEGTALLAEMEEVLRRMRVPAVTVREPGVPQEMVLVVDDNAAIRQLVGAALSPEGYAVLGVENGREALAVVGETAERGDTIGVIVLDLQMPVMSGVEFVRAYHELPCQHAPVVVYSADADAAEKIDALRVDALVEKPGELRTLIAVVAALAAAPPMRLRPNGRYHPRWHGDIPPRWCVWDSRHGCATDHQPTANRELVGMLAQALNQFQTARDQRFWLEHEVRDPK